MSTADSQELQALARLLRVNKKYVYGIASHTTLFAYHEYDY
jgi:hypothetical protein